MAEGSALDLSRLALLISHDRSGSHYLGSFIRMLSNHRMVDEICNEDAVDPETNPLSFFGYRHRGAVRSPDYALRKKPPTVARLLDEYFSFVLEYSAPKSVVVDIKYGHVHNFEVAWWPIFRKPFLFEYARSRQIRLIHLSRWNTLETVVSSEVAEARKIWHAIEDRPEAQPSEAITLDTTRLLEQIALLNAQKDFFSKWLRQSRCLAVTYEELVHPKASAEVRALIANFLGATAPTEFVSPYRKVTPAMHLMVRNWVELKKFCRENALAHYLLPVH